MPVTNCLRIYYGVGRLAEDTTHLDVHAVHDDLGTCREGEDLAAICGAPAAPTAAERVLVAALRYYHEPFAADDVHL